MAMDKAQQDALKLEVAKAAVTYVKDGIIGVDYELRGMEKPSDHAPIWLELS